ncbi:hypothetical protein D3C86_1323290 [compost metagenome]
MGGAAQARQRYAQIAVVVERIDDELGQQAVAGFQVIVAQVQREAFAHRHAGAGPLAQVVFAASRRMGGVVAGISRRVRRSIFGAGPLGNYRRLGRGFAIGGLRFAADARRNGRRIGFLFVGVLKKRVGGQRVFHRRGELQRGHLKQFDGLLKAGRQCHLLAQTQFLHRMAQSSLLEAGRRKAAYA